ncbi:MAG: class I SAM-dependent methyltransferase [Terriglobia bacterium]
MSTATLERIFAERPEFHRGETETKCPISASETILRGRALEGVAKKLPACYGISEETAKFIYDSISKQSKTLETGSGISTLVFALRMASHTVITPNESEISAIKDYANKNQIPLGTVEFVCESSDQYLPRSPIQGLDLVLIDGKHAFPWPAIDWFYTADKLKQGGIVLLDDVEMRSVAILKDFMRVDPRWELTKSFGGHAIAFRKTARSAHDVAWHMQPFITKRWGRKQRILSALGLG